jgi:hypothetical protein
LRADNIVPQGTGTRLRYVNCPQAPFIASTEQNVCSGSDRSLAWRALVAAAMYATAFAQAPRPASPAAKPAVARRPCLPCRRTAATRCSAGGAHRRLHRAEYEFRGDRGTQQGARPADGRQGWFRIRLADGRIGWIRYVVGPIQPNFDVSAALPPAGDGRGASRLPTTTPVQRSMGRPLEPIIPRSTRSGAAAEPLLRETILLPDRWRLTDQLGSPEPLVRPVQRIR